MSTKGRIDQDLKKALMKKDELKVSVLRLLKSDIHNQEIAQKKKKLSDTEVQQVIFFEAKQHMDSVEAFQKGGRDDLLIKEKKELQIIEQYLPKQLSKDEIKKIVQEIIESLGNGEKNFGQVMGQVMQKVKGQADGKTVSRIVKESLSS